MTVQNMMKDGLSDKAAVGLMAVFVNPKVSTAMIYRRAARFVGFSKDPVGVKSIGQFLGKEGETDQQLVDRYNANQAKKDRLNPKKDGPRPLATLESVKVKKHVEEHNLTASYVATTMFEFARKGQVQKLDQPLRDKFGYWQLDKAQDPEGGFVSGITEGFNILTDNPDVRYWAAGVDVANTVYINEDGTTTSVAEKNGIPARYVEAASTGNNELMGAAIQKAVISKTQGQATQQEIAEYIDGLLDKIDRPEIETHRISAEDIENDLNAFAEDDFRLSNFLKNIRKVWPNVEVITNQGEVIKRLQEEGYSDAEALNIIDNTKGFVSFGDFIYLNTKRGTSASIMNTAIHEFGHIWSKAMFKNKPDQWRSGVKALMKTPHWEKQKNRISNSTGYSSLQRVVNLPDPVLLQLIDRARPDASGINREVFKFLDEALAGAIGDNAELRLGTATSKEISAWNNWIDGLVEWIKNLLNIPSKALEGEQFLNTALRDVMQGEKAGSTLAKHIQFRKAEGVPFLNAYTEYDMGKIIEGQHKIERLEASFIVKEKKTANELFNKIVEKKTGIKAEKTFTKFEGRTRGAKKNSWKFFIPYGAEDFQGLLYTVLPKGKAGERAQKF